MKNVFAEAIEKGTARLSFRQFQRYLMKDIIDDDDLYGFIEDAYDDGLIEDRKTDDSIAGAETSGLIEVTENGAEIADTEKDGAIAGITDDYLIANIHNNFQIYFNIIYMLSTDHSSKEIVYFFMNHFSSPMEEEEIRLHIRRVKSKYKKHVEILEALLDAKTRDFTKLGATPQQAMDCLNDWMSYEFGY